MLYAGGEDPTGEDPTGEDSTGELYAGGADPAGALYAGGAGADEVTAAADEAGYPVGEPAGQSVTVAAQLVMVTSVVTSTVEVPQLSPP